MGGGLRVSLRWRVTAEEESDSHVSVVDIGLGSESVSGGSKSNLGRLHRESTALFWGDMRRRREPGLREGSKSNE